MLAFEVPEKWHAGAAYFMNKHTLAQCLTMSDATGRPLLLPTPVVDGAAPGSRWSLAGWPLRIVSFLPDVMPGSTPVMFGNLRELHQLVVRKGLSMNPETGSAACTSLSRELEGPCFAPTQRGCSASADARSGRRAAAEGARAGARRPHPIRSARGDAMSVEDEAREMIATLKAAAAVARRDAVELDELRAEIEEAQFRSQPADQEVCDLINKLARPT
jgi:hypothetical protein